VSSKLFEFVGALEEASVVVDEYDLFDNQPAVDELKDYCSISIPGTSASSERLFSSGKVTISETRSSLSGSTIQACQYLKSWYKSTPNL
jgi:hypothetical protein